MAYEVIILCHLHMPLYFLRTFTEYPFFAIPSRNYKEKSCPTPHSPKLYSHSHKFNLNLT